MSSVSSSSSPVVNVLIVEDNRVLCDSLAFDLAMRGYNVAKAYDGAAALAHMQAGEALPNIIVSDISMPEMDGYELLEAVRSSEDWQDIPFLFLTAHNTQTAIRTGKELGVDDYLVKPFEVDDLVVAMENKLRRLREVRHSAERRLDETRQQFLNLISHELRTPLAPIVGGTELLAESIAVTPDESVQELMELVQAGVDRLQHLLNNVLLFTELNSGNLKPRFEGLARVFDLRDVVQEACLAVAADWELAGKQIDLQIHDPSGPVLVHGIHDVLQALVVEPLRNAFAFSPAGGRVVVEVQRNASGAAVTITDEGPGIPVGQLARIWEPFGQIARGQYEQQGVGLGLPIACAAAELHGGECTIETDSGAGVHFTVRLPLATD